MKSPRRAKRGKKSPGAAIPAAPGARREVCFLVGASGAVLWMDAGESPTRLPDSRARWEAIWERRGDLRIVAHSHPVGPLEFSAEDRTTMAALDGALGRALTYVVVAPDGVLVSEPGEEGRVEAIASGASPWWVELLRAASGMSVEPNE